MWHCNLPTTVISLNLFSDVNCAVTDALVSGTPEHLSLQGWPRFQPCRLFHTSSGTKTFKNLVLIRYAIWAVKQSTNMAAASSSRTFPSIPQNYPTQWDPEIKAVSNDSPAGYHGDSVASHVGMICSYYRPHHGNTTLVWVWIVGSVYNSDDNVIWEVEEKCV